MGGTLQLKFCVTTKGKIKIKFCVSIGQLAWATIKSINLVVPTNFINFQVHDFVFLP